VVYIPSREELYAKANAAFYEWSPDAPPKLNPHNSDHAMWMALWRGSMRAILDMEIDRIYWETYPHAPREIDPADPSHDVWEKCWLEIRDGVMENAPDLVDDDTGPDMSYVRQGVNWGLHGAPALIGEENLAALEAHAERGMAEAEAAAAAQLIGSLSWESSRLSLTLLDGTSAEFYVQAYWDESTGALAGSIMSDPYVALIS
jgi:hypothetical protein